MKIRILTLAGTLLLAPLSFSPADGVRGNDACALGGSCCAEAGSTCVSSGKVKENAYYSSKDCIAKES